MNQKNLDIIRQTLKKLDDLLAGERGDLNDPLLDISVAASSLVSQLASELFILDMNSNEGPGKTFMFFAHIGHYDMAKDLFEYALQVEPSSYSKEWVDRYIQVMTSNRTFTESELRKGVKDLKIQ